MIQRSTARGGAVVIVLSAPGRTESPRRAARRKAGAALPAGVAINSSSRLLHYAWREAMRSPVEPAKADNLPNPVAGRRRRGVRAFGKAQAASIPSFRRSGAVGITIFFP